MITVRCPNCDAAYQLDPAKLADGGRKLKCAQCQTVWVARTPEDEAAHQAALAVEAEAAVKAAEVAAAEAAAPTAEEPKPADDIGYVPPTDDVIVQRTPNVDTLIRVGGWRQWVRGENIWRTGAMAFVVVGVLAGGWVLLHKLMPAKPVEEAVTTEAEPTATVDEVVQPPKGIVLHRVHGEVTELKGQDAGVALTVRGLLTNTTSDGIDVPALRLELLGKDGKVADMWPVSGVSGTMLPKSEQAWTVSLTAPDMSSVKGWRVVFVKPKGQAAPQLQAAPVVKEIPAEPKMVEEPVQDEEPVAEPAHEPAASSHEADSHDFEAPAVDSEH